jgi:hypothetical protein
MVAPLDDDLLDALIGRVATDVAILAKLDLKSAPLPAPSRGRSADRADYLFALWQASEAAVQSAGSSLASADRRKARAACDRIFVVASTFDRFIEAARDPSGENLAALVILGGRLGRISYDPADRLDVIRGPIAKGGRPRGSAIYAESDAPLVRKLKARIDAGERPTVAATALEGEAKGPRGQPGSKAKRLLRALNADRN